MFVEWVGAVIDVFADFIGSLYLIELGGVPLAWILISLSVVAVLIRYLFGKA